MPRWAGRCGWRCRQQLRSEKNQDHGESGTEASIFSKAASWELCRSVQFGSHAFQAQKLEEE